MWRMTFHVQVRVCTSFMTREGARTRCTCWAIIEEITAVLVPA